MVFLFWGLCFFWARGHQLDILFGTQESMEELPQEKTRELPEVQAAAHGSRIVRACVRAPVRVRARAFACACACVSALM